MESNTNSSEKISHAEKNLELIQNFFDGRLSKTERVNFDIKLRDPEFVRECELFTDIASRIIGSTN